ncbi:methylmalonyl-CoA mutase family protein [Nonomuraea sp. NPDC050556]|uniref:methylmalonyl-CoA mutase family protein n=1 Tax=Nonomuraea sp. NPDC050556 TaxID=3364369 RepID=UPI00378F49CB
MELAAGFPSVTRDEWRELALGVLRKSGAPEESLYTRTYDGVRIAPLYDASDLPAAQVRGSRTDWDVRQRHTVADPEAVMADLENGVTSLWLVVGEGAIGVDDLPALLKDVYLDLAPIVLESSSSEAGEVLLELAAARGVALRGNLGAPGLAARCLPHPGLRSVVVDGTPYHDMGGSDVEELGCSIALGVGHLRELTAAGLTMEEAFGQLEFRYAASADQFGTIAKLRAARKLWARVAEVCGVAAGQVQHAVTSSAMMTARDPWVNMLRTTLACFAAGVGGADAVTVQPFDACLGLPDGFSRRIARNTQSLLLEEAGVGRVADPGGGSYYVERLTAELASQAWAWFQEIEAGASVEKRIAVTRARRDDDIAHRRFPITGVSEFPNLGERRFSATNTDMSRYARPFEALRDLADAQPVRPAVFLATIGPVAAYTARASFAANLFQAGGLDTPSAGPGSDPSSIAAAFAESGSAVACLCSSDKLYGEHAAAVADALRRAGARKVWLAGKGEYDGVDAHVYAGCDALDVLRTTFDDLGVTR